MTLGTHFILDLAGAPFAALDDERLVHETLVVAVAEMGARVLGVYLHRLEPQGVSGVVVISESHLTIHTWPERGEAAIDLFSCGDPARARDAARRLPGKLSASSFTLREIPRGVSEAPEAPEPSL